MSGALYAARNDSGARPESSLLAQQSDSDESADAAGESKPEDDREKPRQKAAGPAEGDGDAFGGSAKPAGPDLTVDEERDLISRGWD